MFSWFFKKNTPLEQHTKFISKTSWICELNQPINKEFIHQLFYETFDFENYTICKTHGSIIAILPSNYFYARLTFGKTKESDVLIIVFHETDDNVIVSPIIRVFGESLEKYGLLKETEQKIPKQLKQLNYVEFNQFAFDTNFEISENERRCSAVLKTDTNILKIFDVLSKIVSKEGFTGVKRNTGLQFEKGKEIIIAHVGKNKQKDTIMNLQWNEEVKEWIQLAERIGKSLAEKRQLAVFEKLEVKV
ncbi:hypothetical protein EDI_199720 [Entamoeba dispar SAW760]|uniref:Uncharacterized protein n=1 Tax=Entamoeba dispar (strain ATCC PRA-260 / SAW760) TaxID=370354 RepID=B0EC30_ENTDS|nr:uncharacterized protein EDI_199720 [Entamoeba dispar SAW760]EDR27920.1 hypothetical protein EDI_199720 [Entamoeba dispar SAW760]|eukprot:EDR27920.1 hypothetical protein EDI_199720 [Entamoeba dispar SAW760]